jgi:hypothetical protein
LNKKKILITGYPHTGTTILKSKFGECKNVYEIVNEGDIITHNHIASSGDKEFVLIKTPVYPIEIRKYGFDWAVTNDKSIYKDYHIVIVNRNPYNLFTSIIKRGFNPLSGCKEHLQAAYHHTIEEYLASCERFIDAQNNNYKNIYTIRYEDFFDNDGQNIKSIMDSIGLEYESDIFNIKTKDYKINQGLEIPNKEPDVYDYNGIYRNWQINQPFQNMNSEVNIPDELSDILKNSNIVQELGYSDPRTTG